MMMLADVDKTDHSTSNNIWTLTLAVWPTYEVQPRENKYNGNNDQRREEKKYMPVNVRFVY